MYNNSTSTRVYDGLKTGRTTNRYISCENEDRFEDHGHWRPPTHLFDLVLSDQLAQYLRCCRSSYYRVHRGNLHTVAKSNGDLLYRLLLYYWLGHHSWYGLPINLHLIPKLKTLLIPIQVTTDCGPIGHMQPLFPFRSGLLLQAVVLPKTRSEGGLAIIVPIIASQILIKIHIPCVKDCFTLI